MPFVNLFYIFAKITLLSFDMGNNLEELLKTSKEVVGWFRYERTINNITHTLSIVCVFVLMIYGLCTGELSIEKAFAILGASGVVAYSTGRILSILHRVFNFIERGHNNRQSNDE